MRDQPLATWKDYLTFRAVERASAFLPKAFVDEQFAFYGKVLSGTPKLRDRWKRGVDVTDAALGEVVGKLYVARYFPPSEKARAEEMVRNVIAAFAPSASTASTGWRRRRRRKAKAKLAVLKVGVGYPDKWRDYSGLEVVRGDALGNARARLAVRVPLEPGEARPAGRPRRVGDEPAARQRGQPAGDERAQLPGGDPAAALLRSGAAGGHGLRRHRRRHRPRDQPQLRRPGRAVRRERAARKLVDEGGLRPLQGVRREASSGSTTPIARSPTSRSTAS